MIQVKDELKDRKEKIEMSGKIKVGIIGCGFVVGAVRHAAKR